MRPDFLQLLREARSFDGAGNNPVHAEWGAAHTPFVRWLTPDYADDVGAPSGARRRSAREISNLISAQQETRPNRRGVSDFVWQWGQFLDHDLDETPVLVPEEPFDIPVPAGDPWFDPEGLGTGSISLDRSFYEIVLGVRQQVNELSAFIDASNVYGSDAERAVALRVLDGSGRLATSAGNLLPFNEAGLANAPSPDPQFFLAGDLRANEQVGLTAMHTLFVREHNYWADRIRETFASSAPQAQASGRGNGRDERRRRSRGRRGVARRLTGDEVYHIARAIVGAEMQAISYREFLPVLLGRGALGPYSGYRIDVDPSIANVFAAASYRFGHSMLSPVLQRLDATGTSLGNGPLPLAQAFFRPDLISRDGIEPLLRGLAAQPAQEVDVMVVDAIRNFLFGMPGSGGFDLASLNIQRGRDHGVPGFNQLRQELGLRPLRSLADVSSDPDVRARLTSAYSSVDEVDAWVGGLAEDHVSGALVGPTVRAVLARQFRALRDGDRFWYQRYLSPQLQTLVERQTLAVIIRRNTSIGRELPDDLWHVR
ncbi:MAG: peroxidase family protein [Planctomycetota bacterium]